MDQQISIHRVRDTDEFLRGSSGIPVGRYCKLISRDTGDTIAYIDRLDNNRRMHGELHDFMTEVYETWTIDDAEVETYGMAFEAIPIFHASEMAVISFGWSRADREETDKGPWLWES